MYLDALKKVPNLEIRFSNQQQLYDFFFPFQARRKLKFLFFIIAVSVLFIKISLDTSNISASYSVRLPQVKLFSSFGNLTVPTTSSPTSSPTSLITTKKVTPAQSKNVTTNSKKYKTLRTKEGVLKGTHKQVVAQQVHPNDNDYDNIVKQNVKVVDLMKVVSNLGLL